MSSMSLLEKEMVELSAFDPITVRGETRQAQLARLARVLAAMDEEDWEKLSTAAKLWSNDATEQIGHGELITDPSPGDGDEGGEAPPRRRSVKAEQPVDEPAEEEQTVSEAENDQEDEEAPPAPRRRAAAPKRAAALKVAAKKVAKPKVAAKKAAPKRAAAKERKVAETVVEAPLPSRRRAPPIEAAAPAAAPRRAAKTNGAGRHERASKEVLPETLSRKFKLPAEFDGRPTSSMTGIKILLARDPSLSSAALQRLLELNGLEAPEKVSIRTSRTQLLHTFSVLRQEGLLAS